MFFNLRQKDKFKKIKIHLQEKGIDECSISELDDDVNKKLIFVKMNIPSHYWFDISSLTFCEDFSNGLIPILEQVNVHKETMWILHFFLMIKDKEIYSNFFEAAVKQGDILKSGKAICMENLFHSWKCNDPVIRKEYPGHKLILGPQYNSL